jgi:predicted site-specific integrase-resolvase
MKLSDYAKKHSMGYRTAWNHFKAGLIPNAKKLPSGMIVVDDDEVNIKAERTAVYARVSSSENKTNLVSQSKRVQDFCSAKGWVVSMVVEECGNGLNDDRKKLKKLLSDKSVTRIVVEHKDRLTRFGFTYIKDLWHGEIVIINEVVEDESDLMQDFVSLVTSFTARLYGRRRSKRQTEKLIAQLQNEDTQSV